MNNDKPVNRTSSVIVMNGTQLKLTDNNNTKQFCNINSKQINNQIEPDFGKCEEFVEETQCNGNCSINQEEPEKIDSKKLSDKTDVTSSNSKPLPIKTEEPVTVDVKSILTINQNGLSKETPTLNALSSSFQSTVTIPTTTPPSSISTSTYTSVTNSSTSSTSSSYNSNQKFNYNYINGPFRAYHRPRDIRPRRCVSRSPHRYSGLWMNGDYEKYPSAPYTRNSEYFNGYSTPYLPSAGGMNDGSYETSKFRSNPSERRYNGFCSANSQSGDPLYNTFHKNMNHNTFYSKYQNSYPSHYALGRGSRLKGGRGEDSNWHSFHPDPAIHNSFYTHNSNYQRPNPQCPAHNGGNNRYFRGGLPGRGRGRTYSSSLSPRITKANIRNQKYRFKTPPPSPGPRKWDRSSPITPHYYDEDASLNGLTVDVGGGLGNLEECSTLSSFCGFGLGGGLLCLEDDGSRDSKDDDPDDTKSSYICEKDDLEDREGGHVVHFHINPGTTVNFTNIEGEVQRISGPATVRMVSTNSSPPIPLPVQMPPGHVVQQIVDETGTLQHVILSAQPMTLPVCSYGPNTGQGPPQYYSPPPQGPPPPQGYMTSYQPAQYSPVMSPPLTQHSPPPHSYQKNDRNSRQHEKIRNKYYQRHSQMQHHHYQSQAPPPQPKSCASSIHGSLQSSPKKAYSDNSVHLRAEEDTNGDSAEEPQMSLQRLLSLIKPPEVSNVEPYSATIHWEPPDLSSYPQKEISVSSLRYEVFLNKNIYDTVSSTHLVLSNLRPATEYKLHFVCMCDGVRGCQSNIKVFCTKATIPDPPQPPRLYDRKKQSLTFKWNAPKDNGSKIIHYNLEVCGGHFGRWTEVCRNRNKEFTVHKLQPQTTYRFRLSACNEIGDSDYSPETIATTLGLAPTQPNPPNLNDSSINYLSLSWTKRSSDEEFSLEMEDSVNEYGFRPIFCGSETSYTCQNLRRNADYKFRICCQNVNGKSPYSEIVCYRTLPDKPQNPSAPILKGKSHPDKLNLCWKPPIDHGGTPVTSYHVEIDRGNGFEEIYNGPSLECEATNLSPGRCYETRVAAVSAGGKSRWSEVGSATTSPVAPGHCKPPRIVGKPRANTLQLKWAPPSFDGGSIITEYQVEMMTSNTSERRQVYCGRDTECTIASLLPGRPYMFVLRAVNRVGAGLWSEPFEVVSGAGPPDAPRAPHLACKGPHVVLVSWDEPINNGAGIELYTVQMAEVSSPSTESSESSSTCGDPDCELTYNKVYTGSSPSAEVRNLTPANTYAFRVSASNCAGAGSFSVSATVTTPAAPPASVAHITSTAEAVEIMLHWTEPACHGDPITQYNIEVGEQLVTTPGPALEYLLTDLLPETAYKIRVQAVNSVGVSPFSSAHRVTTQPLPPSPPQIELLKASFNSLRLKWGDGRNPDLLKYSLQMELLNPHNNSMEFYQVYRGTNQTFKVGKLEENTSYKLRICATNEAGIGPYSEPVEFTTTKAPPPPLKAPRVAEGPDGTYCVEWCGVRCPGDDRIVYRLQVLQAGKDQDYSLVYTGSETSFILTDLEQQTGYYLRVCGVRMNGDKEVVAGAYSSPTLFNTPKVEVVECVANTAIDSQKTSFEWCMMSDHQKALAILIVFSLLAFIAAYVLSPSER